MSHEGKRLDELLRKRAMAKPQALPPELVQSLLFMRVERVLLLEIREACKGQALALKAIETMLEQGGGALELQSALRAMTAAREGAVSCINEFSAFSTDPHGWLARSRAAGRLAKWARFGIA